MTERVCGADGRRTTSSKILRQIVEPCSCRRASTSPTRRASCSTSIRDATWDAISGADSALAAITITMAERYGSHADPRATTRSRSTRPTSAWAAVRRVAAGRRPGPLPSPYAGVLPLVASRDARARRYNSSLQRLRKKEEAKAVR